MKKTYEIVYIKEIDEYNIFTNNNGKIFNFLHIDNWSKNQICQYLDENNFTKKEEIAN